MKTALLFLLIELAVIISSQNIKAQCSVSITNNGKGCVGDTLIVSVSSARQIEWKRGKSVIKSIGQPRYGITVAGNKYGGNGSDSFDLFYPEYVFVDKKGNVYASDMDNNRIQKWSPGATYGITVAGSKKGLRGNDSAHLREPRAVFVDDSGNVYVSDGGNNRVQKWAPGAKYGITVAGDKNGISGTGSNYLNEPEGILVDSAGNIYIADEGNNRIQKWLKGAKFGITVAGDSNGVSGVDSMHLNSPRDIDIDRSGNIFICDRVNNRIQKWERGSSYGFTVAGQKDGSFGSDSTHLTLPEGIHLDHSNDIYIADKINNRVQKWTLGSSYGVTIAGNGSYGTDSLTLFWPTSVWVDSSNNIYVTDNYNSRIQKWSQTCSNYNGTFYIITDSAGIYSAKVYDCFGCKASSNTIKVSQYSSYTVATICNGQKYNFNGGLYTSTGIYTSHFTSYTGCDSMVSLFLTVKGTSYSTIFTSIFSGKTYTFNGKSLSTSGIYYDTLMNNAGCDSIITLNLLVSKFTHSGHGCLGDTLKLYVKGATRIEWRRGNHIIKTIAPKYYGVTVAGQKDGTSGNDSTHLLLPCDMIVDTNGNIYVSDMYNHRVQKWASGLTYGVTVAGQKNGIFGSDSTKLYFPGHIFLDANGNIFIPDAWNYRIQRWSPGSTYGITVAGMKNGQSGCDSIRLNTPTGVYLDSADNIYIADYKNNRVQRWLNGAKSATTIAGQSNGTSGSNYKQLNGASDVYLDKQCNTYVSDYYNGRIQKWSPNAKNITTVAGNPAGYSGSDSLHLNSPNGIYVDTNGDVYIADSWNNRVQKWKYGAKYGITVAGQKDCSYGTDSVHLNNPWGVTLDKFGNIYVADAYNSRIQKWVQDTTTYNGIYTYVTDSIGAYQVTVNYTNESRVTSDSLIIKSTSTDTINATICNSKSYSFNGSTYTSGGIYTATLVNINGCDSFVVLNLIVNENSSYSFYRSICPGQSYQFNGGTYYTAGIYSAHLTNSLGCDSQVSLHLKLNLDTLFHLGNGCIGDTLSLLHSTAEHIILKRDNTIVQTIGGTMLSHFGITVAGHIVSGTDSTSLNYASGVFVDSTGNIYVSDESNNRVQKWVPGAAYGITVAGHKDGTYGKDSTYLHSPEGLFVDKHENIYVADAYNNRIQKWALGSNYGITVAGQNDTLYNADSAHLFAPYGVYVDNAGNIYVADNNNNRIQKWAPGSKYGITIAGDKNGASGSDSSHLYGPTGVYVDDKGSIFIADQYNSRIQKWNKGGTYGITVAGDKNGNYGTDSFHLSYPSGVQVDANGNVYTTDDYNNRIQKWAPAGMFGVTIAGYKDGTSGNDSTQLSYPSGIYLDAGGGFYIADYMNNRVQKWMNIIQTDTLRLVADSSGIYTAQITYLNGCTLYSNVDSIKNCTNGINEATTNHSSFVAYPNPNDGNFIVQVITKNCKDKAHIQVMSVFGQIVTEQFANNEKGRINAIFLNEQLASGLYLIKVYIGSETHMQRIVIEK